MQPVAIPLAGLDWDESIPGARTKMAVVGDRRFRLVHFTEEYEGKDWCTTPHEGYVFAGKLVLDVNGHRVSVSEGDGFRLDGSEPHRHKVTIPPGGMALALIVDDAP